MKKYFLAGITVILPLAVTVYVLYVTYKFIDVLAGNIFKFLTGYEIPGIGFAATIIIIFLIGVLATNILGRKILGWWENLFFRIPIANSIYRTVKQIVDTLSRKDGNAFRKVVMVEYPRRDCWVIAFLIGDAPSNLCTKAGKNLTKVFVPTVPNPTSGFLIMVPREDLVVLPISIEQGMKFVLSAGIVTPDELRKQSYND
ncbi:MAG: DUF502 domain-containing protein [Peptococcaceae bacterium]|nr:DUF502 domain-containing protein [Peptococcaceae bacterium]